MKKKRTTYKEKADQLQEIIELAENVITNSKYLTIKEKEDAINFGQRTLEMINNPEPQYRKVKSLLYLENAFLTFWNEAKGEDVEKFWKNVYDNNLNFKRKDVLNIVLKRKRIKNIHEYNTIVDNLVIAEQIGKINKREMKELGNMIDQFENSMPKNK